MTVLSSVIFTATFLNTVILRRFYRVSVNLSTFYGFLTVEIWPVLFLFSNISDLFVHLNELIFRGFSFDFTWFLIN